MKADDLIREFGLLSDRLLKGGVSEGEFLDLCEKMVDVVILFMNEVERLRESRLKGAEGDSTVKKDEVL